MSQAVRDLPDPLDPSPSLSTSDPDDLLSKMADEAIDRLIAEADNGRPPVSLPPATPAAEMPATAADDLDEDEGPTYPAASATPGMTADNRIVAVESGEPKPVDMVEPAEVTVDSAPPDEIHPEEPPPSEAVADSASETEALAPMADEVPRRAADRDVLLAEPLERPSVLLFPLRLLNWPFAWIGDNARRVFGLIGIVTLVPAIAAIVYVLWLKQRWG